MGAMIPWMGNELKRHGKVAFITINPRTNGINVAWKTPGTAVSVGSSGEEADVMQDARYLHQFQGKRAYLVNQATGSPLQVDPEIGSFMGLSGVSIYKQHRDNRVRAVQASGGMDLAALAKYTLIGISIIGVLLLILLAAVFGGEGSPF